METSLMNLFQKYLDKQDALKKALESEILHDFGYSEIHTIAAVGDLQEPNVTSISKYLNMTRGAISKITKKLIARGLIVAEKRGNNKQKIFYQLTDTGKKIYLEHAKIHELCLKRDEEFLGSCKKEELKTVLGFMEKYNEYLDKKLGY